jgi:hypothetical protein
LVAGRKTTPYSYKVLAFLVVSKYPLSTTTRLKNNIVKLAVVVILSSCVNPAWGQRADVPQVDKDGNFRSSRVQGNRGFYHQTHWLVVDRDVSGLNCREMPQGKPYALFQYGDIVKAHHFEPGDDAISIVNGQTWLRVTSQETWRIVNPAQSGGSRTVECIVRANSAFIAPINLDDLRNIKW